MNIVHGGKNNILYNHIILKDKNAHMCMCVYTYIHTNIDVNNICQCEMHNILMLYKTDQNQHHSLENYI